MSKQYVASRQDLSNTARPIRENWWDFDNVNLPEWASEKSATPGQNEELGKLFCSLLNSYIPYEYASNGTRYHLLNRYPSGRLYFHLLNRPRGTE